MKKIDKRDRASLFRVRLTEAMRLARTNQTALARDAGVDRSTVSQLLSGDAARLPNAHLVGACAAALGVSADWLLGLSDRPENAADLMAHSMTMTDAARALVDETIFGWHREAAGYKIRHVPATLPDMLKTPAVLDWEYGPHLGRSASEAIAASQERLAWMRASLSDYEIAIPMHELASFAEGNGYYAGLSADIRAEQLDHLIDQVESLYPRLRLSLFDARRLFSAPITVFGPLLAVIYLGRSYLAFRDTDRIAAMTAHFDHLVREASVAERAVAEYLAVLRSAL
ncbi:helix-turn-helix domain-containing protein [Thalassococcus sp. CAU 1522]|uniref:Helix-turn-helix domain-containing protein n=1 Tax=Thalassococcus arenae TaxID=2851652 RepID=A0ABS6N3Z2_9RHOB|nr:helix-turn-helix transcriptional regulator [Thalassococcus arenae]MBV2358730.1 helix-turn-helix domain-containing protein [Thalassococcus arenae]